MTTAFGRRTLIGAMVCAMATWFLAPAVRAEAPEGTLARTTAALPLEQRIDALLKQMTLEEKIDMIGGVKGFYIRGNERLGLPEFKMSDGPNGVRNYGPTTAYPAGVELAASWDLALARRYGEGLGRDARARGVHFLLAPGVNIYRVPQCGRNFEYFGEDPFLAGKVATGYIQGVQSQRVCATVKHFAANNHENDRNRDSSEVEERTLEEIYFPAFKAAVQEGKVGAVMCSYNLINGTYASANDWLQNQTLKKQWGFTGLVMSDWGAVHETRGVFSGGMDLEMPSGKYMNRTTLLPLIKDGTLPEAVLDDKIRRILRVAISMGWLDQVQTDKNIPLDDPQNAAVALDVARGGIVLLKNQDRRLPLDRTKIKSIVVLGPNADPAVVGGGGSGYATPFHAVSVLDGLRDKAGAAIKVTRISAGNETQERQFARSSTFVAPLKAEFFNNTNLTGNPVFTREDACIDFEWDGKSPAQGINQQNFSARWTGKITATKSGPHEFMLQSDDGSRLRVDGKTVIDFWGAHAVGTETRTLTLEAGKTYDIAIDYFQASADAVMRFGWGSVVSHEISAESIAQIAQADVAVVCVGFSKRRESEGGDRSYQLPKDQAELIQMVAKTNPRTVVILNAGGNVEMANWIDQVPTLIHAWYPGQAGGTALAEILFGDVNPSGKLPVSLEKRWEDSAAFGNFPATDRKIKYAEGIFVGYRHFDAKNIEPRFPFGYGLSYTTFTYGEATLSTKALAADGTLTVTVPVTNSGKCEGAETVQLYVHDAKASVPRPPQELKGFQKLFLKSGETKTATFTITRADLSFWDVITHAWKAEPGTFEIRVGASSRDIRAKGEFELK